MTSKIVNTDVTFIQRLKVNDYVLPVQDGTPNESIQCDGEGNVFFAPLHANISGIIGGGGSGTNNRIVRWDGSLNFQDSAVTVDDSGNVSGISTLVVSGTANLGGLQYPTADGGSNEALSTDGGGVLSFSSLGTNGSGTAFNLARWSGTSNVQDSLVDAVVGGTTIWSPRGVTVNGDINTTIATTLNVESLGNTSLACVDVSISSTATRCNMIGSQDSAIEGGALRCGLISCTSGLIEGSTTNACQITSVGCTMDTNCVNASFVSCLDCSMNSVAQSGMMASSECII